ncbi:MAG: hypothetical protein M0P71_13785 [Melioribacteraceae bacterium]|nr:hypothetical protein [Melioribacteraceae bacterium]
MPKYQYSCDNCSIKKDNGSQSSNSQIKNYDPETMSPGYHPDTGEYIFFIECKMKDKPQKPNCPFCKSNKHVNVNYTDLNLQCYVRGNGLVKDKAGAKRDMHRHKLKHEDPYSTMRQSGEVDFLSDKFRRGGMDLSPKSNTDSIVHAKERRRIELEKEVSSLSDIHKKIIVDVFKNQTGITTTELSKHSDDINKHLTTINNKYIYYHNKKEIWLPLAEGNRIYEEIIGI